MKWNNVYFIRSLFIILGILFFFIAATKADDNPLYLAFLILSVLSLVYAIAGKNMLRGI